MLGVCPKEVDREGRNSGRGRKDSSSTYSGCPHQGTFECMKGKKNKYLKYDLVGPVTSPAWMGRGAQAPTQAELVAVRAGRVRFFLRMWPLINPTISVDGPATKYIRTAEIRPSVL